MSIKMKKEILNLNNLSKLPTKYLLGLFRRSQKAQREYTGPSPWSCIDYEQDMYDFFERWSNNFKKELDKREHIDTNKILNKKIRKYCSKNGVSKEMAKKRILNTQ